MPNPRIPISSLLYFMLREGLDINATANTENEIGLLLSCQNPALKVLMSVCWCDINLEFCLIPRLLRVSAVPI